MPPTQQMHDLAVGNHIGWILRYNHKIHAINLQCDLLFREICGTTSCSPMHTKDSCRVHVSLGVLQPQPSRTLGTKIKHSAAPELDASLSYAVSGELGFNFPSCICYVDARGLARILSDRVRFRDSGEGSTEVVAKVSATVHEEFARA